MWLLPVWGKRKCWAVVFLEETISGRVIQFGGKFITTAILLVSVCVCFSAMESESDAKGKDDTVSAHFYISLLLSFHPGSCAAILMVSLFVLANFFFYSERGGGVVGLAFLHIVLFVSLSKLTST